MRRNVLFLTLLVVLSGLFCLHLTSNTAADDRDGKIIGQILYRKTSEPLFAAKAILFKDGKSVRKGGVANGSGHFVIIAIQPDTFDLKITNPSCATVLVKNVSTQPGNTTDIGKVELIYHYPYTRGTYEIYDTTNSLSDRSWFVQLDYETEPQKKKDLQEKLKFTRKLTEILKNDHNLKLRKDSTEAIGVLQLLPECDKSKRIESVYITFISERWKTCLLIKNFNLQKEEVFLKYLAWVIAESMKKMKFDPIIQYEG